MTDALYQVIQTAPDGSSTILYECNDVQQARAEAHRINCNLADRGIPGWVSCAYVYP